MVVQIHTGEFYYIGPGGSALDTPAAHWVGLAQLSISLLRPAIRDDFGSLSLSCEE
jgi:hypothetical protein